MSKNLKKLFCILTVIVWIVALLIIRYIWQVFIPEPNIIQTAKSPDGKYVVYVYESNGGSTTGFIYHVTVLDADKKLGKGNGNICTSEYSLSVKWKEANVLSVKNSGNCTKQRIKKHGISIEYNSYKETRARTNIKLDLKNDSTQDLLKQIQQTVISEMYGDVSLQLIDIEYIPDFKSGYVSLRYLVPNKPVGRNAETILSVGVILKEEMVEYASEYGLDKANIGYSINIAQWKLGKSEVEKLLKEKKSEYEICSIEGYYDSKRGEEWLAMVDDPEGALIYWSINPYSGEMQIVDIF